MTVEFDIDTPVLNPGAAQALLALLTSRRDVSLDDGVAAEQDEATRPVGA